MITVLIKKIATSNKRAKNGNRFDIYKKVALIIYWILLLNTGFLLDKLI